MSLTHAELRMSRDRVSQDLLFCLPASSESRASHFTLVDVAGGYCEDPYATAAEAANAIRPLYAGLAERTTEHPQPVDLHNTALSTIERVHNALRGGRHGRRACAAYGDLIIAGGEVLYTQAGDIALYALTEDGFRTLSTTQRNEVGHLTGHVGLTPGKPEYQQHFVSLNGSVVLILTSDGLTDTLARLGDPTHLVRAALAASAEPSEIRQHLTAMVLRAGGPVDDIASVIIHLTAEPAPCIFTIPGFLHEQEKGWRKLIGRCRKRKGTIPVTYQAVR